jgi:hypothetical protein
MSAATLAEVRRGDWIKLSAASAPSTGRSHFSIGRSALAIPSDISGLNGDVSTLFDLRSRDRRDVREGIATAIAIAPAPMPSAPGKVAYTVNGARFRGENAIGGAVSYRLNSTTPFAIGAGFSYAGNKNNGVRVGVSGEF